VTAAFVDVGAVLGGGFQLGGRSLSLASAWACPIVKLISCRSRNCDGRAAPCLWSTRIDFLVPLGDTIVERRGKGNGFVMNKKQTKILEAIFADPVRANIAWRDVEFLLVALGADVTGGGGSFVGVALNGVRAVFHKPHPEKEVGRGMVRRLRVFLREAGV